MPIHREAPWIHFSYLFEWLTARFAPKARLRRSEDKKLCDLADVTRDNCRGVISPSLRGQRTLAYPIVWCSLSSIVGNSGA